MWRTILKSPDLILRNGRLTFWTTLDVQLDRHVHQTYHFSVNVFWNNNEEIEFGRIDASPRNIRQENHSFLWILPGVSDIQHLSSYDKEKENISNYYDCLLDFPQLVQSNLVWNMFSFLSFSRFPLTTLCIYTSEDYICKMDFAWDTSLFQQKSMRRWWLEIRIGTTTESGPSSVSVCCPSHIFSFQKRQSEASTGISLLCGAQLHTLRLLLHFSHAF